MPYEILFIDRYAYEQPKAQISLISGILLMIPCILFATAISTPADSFTKLIKKIARMPGRRLSYITSG